MDNVGMQPLCQPYSPHLLPVHTRCFCRPHRKAKLEATVVQQKRLSASIVRYPLYLAFRDRDRCNPFTKLVTPCFLLPYAIITLLLLFFTLQSETRGNSGTRRSLRADRGHSSGHPAGPQRGGGAEGTRRQICGGQVSHVH